MIQIILILLAFLTFSAVGFVAFVQKRRERDLLRMRDLVRSRGALTQDVEVSIFDVFWDLGASDFALEVMAGQHLLPYNPQELPLALDSLSDRIKEEGSYDGLVRESLETIQEFYTEHRRTGARRALPMLTTRNRKTLALPAVDAQAPQTPIAEIPRALQLRQATRAVGLVEADVQPFEIDLDDIARVEPLGILKGIFLGRSEELDRWWQMRALRTLRDELNGHLRSLYDAYAFEATSDPDFYRSLYDLAQRWTAETQRLRDLQERAPWKAQPWALAAHALTAEACETAEQLAFRAKANVDQTIELIHSHARRGDVAMAGYLVFLNHHAFFVGRTQRYGQLIQRIETTTYRIQDEIRKLSKKNVI